MTEYAANLYKVMRNSASGKQISYSSKLVTRNLSVLAISQCDLWARSHPQDSFHSQCAQWKK